MLVMRVYRHLNCRHIDIDVKIINICRFREKNYSTGNKWPKRSFLSQKNEIIYYI